MLTDDLIKKDGGKQVCQLDVRRVLSLLGHLLPKPAAACDQRVSKGTVPCGIKILRLEGALLRCRHEPVYGLRGLLGVTVVAVFVSSERATEGHPGARKL
jgi:hypothetical protein